MFQNVDLIKEIVAWQKLTNLNVIPVNAISISFLHLILVSDLTLKTKNFEAYIFSNSNLPDCKVRDVWTIGNGHCQDEMNNYPCNFDGGDCCYPEFLYYKV